MQNLPYVDVHTHNPEQASGVVSVVNILVGKDENLTLPVRGFFSAGLHPWYIDENTLDEDFAEIEALTENKMLAAIGEAGLDMLANSHLDLQKQVFERHLLIASKCIKPLMVHCVKAHNEVISLYKKSGLDVVLIFHGFNNNLEIAGQLLKHGCYLSFGEALLNKNSNAARLITRIPLDKLLLETDDADVSINEIYQNAARLLDLEIERLKEIILRNFKNCFGDLL